ncbi:MAG TPA: lmo0937 family membrane protein [Bacteroidia bacterium]|jgi:hypothetical protein|nr:lmo0937 family membrane protein [Bacteroidia bacterium]
MKNLYKIILPGIAALVLYSSCNSRSGLALTKRRYNNGYYVDHVNARPAPAPVQHPLNPENNPVATSGLSRVDVTPPMDASLACTEENASAGQTKAIALKSHVAKKEKHAAAETNSVMTRTIGVQPVAMDMLQSYAKNPFQLRYALSKMKKAVVDDAADDARSLLWIIIVLILILWLIGVIAGGFGLGEFIHILLIIALVLFILWLLRLL